MKNFINYIKHRISLSEEEENLILKYFVPEVIPVNRKLLVPGKTERYIYFLSSGIVKGYKNINGKLIVEHLVEELNFFSSIHSFTNEIPSEDYFETITECNLLKISKPDLEFLKGYSEKWNQFVESITNEHLDCKMQRVRDFQTLSAKERYLKFIKESPHLALHVSIDNIASFLGMEPQSLSRIRKQVVF